jgi:hypothetical protein
MGEKTGAWGKKPGVQSPNTQHTPLQRPSSQPEFNRGAEGDDTRICYKLSGYVLVIVWPVAAIIHCLLISITHKIAHQAAWAADTDSATTVIRSVIAWLAGLLPWSKVDFGPRRQPSLHSTHFFAIGGDGNGDGDGDGDGDGNGDGNGDGDGDGDGDAGAGSESLSLRHTETCTATHLFLYYYSKPVRQPASQVKAILKAAPEPVLASTSRHHRAGTAVG